MLEGEIAEPVDYADYLISGVLNLLFGVFFAEADTDGVVPPFFVVGDGL